MTNFRITKPNPHNWVIERFYPGGDLITRGKFAGQIAVDRWKVEGYYSRLKYAAEALLDKATGEISGDDPAAILAAIEKATNVVLQAVQEAKPAEKTQREEDEAKLKVPEEWHEQIKRSASPVTTYLRLRGGKRFKRSSAETAAGLTPEQALFKRME